MYDDIRILIKKNILLILFLAYCIRLTSIEVRRIYNADLPGPDLDRGETQICCCL